MPSERRKLELGPQVTRRGLLKGASALTAAGWVTGVAGGWMLRPKWGHAQGPIKMGVATDITGAIAPSGTRTGR
jgi:hypothetical protein